MNVGPLRGFHERLRPLDQAFCAWPAAASILLARAVKT
jgi:hypothetical protein